MGYMFLFFKHYLFEYTGKVPRTVEYHYTFDSSTLLTTIPLCKLKINSKKVKRIFLILRNILFTKQVFRLPICYVWGRWFSTDSWHSYMYHLCPFSPNLFLYSYKLGIMHKLLKCLSIYIKGHSWSSCI